MSEFTLDDELLNPDVLVLGSGLQETYLAWQLSTLGLRILHLDRNQHYGGSQACLTLNELESFLTSSSQTFTDATVSRINADKLKSPRQYNLALAPHLIYPKQKLYRILEQNERVEVYSWGVVDGFFTYVPAGEEGKVGDSGVSGKLAGAIVKARKWNRRNRSSVASMASFASTETTTSTAPGEEPARDKDDGLIPRPGWNQGRFRRAPSSEEDIAWAPDISDADRATMGQFLRSTAVAPPVGPSESDSSNEAELRTLLNHLTETYPLPPSLISRITSLLLTHTPPSTLPLSIAMQKLRNHASNLATVTNVPSAAALIVSYGQLGEICQDWARLVAVNGGTNILGRHITSLTQHDNTVSATLNSGETVTAKWVVGSEAELSGLANVDTLVGRQTLRKGIYIIDRDLEQLFAFKGAEGKVQQYQLPSAAVLYYPSESVGNENPILVMARSSVTADCPKGQTVLYLSCLKGTAGVDGPMDKAVETLLDGCEWNLEAQEKPEVVWKAQWNQIVGTNAKIDGRTLRLGELGGDLSVGDEVWENLDGWVDMLAEGKGKREDDGDDGEDDDVDEEEREKRRLEKGKGKATEEEE
ncbi:hypothetical protein BJ508DRAFT_363967 [Ascobolus immersus RN42]|uniref:Rab proteins geranylgeranyltransferase n=1 Tax=Ascobolus immersus RN42 TaxID=1160509 RepID=A0A3N4HYQ3_ASCIM|nr:hypothetical protein BJ508DRAFT_363967 [Ascobolus immersus RN42]